VSGDLWYIFNWDVIWRHFDKLWLGLALGLGIAVLSLLIGCIIGLAAAGLPPAQSVPASGYVPPGFNTAEIHQPPSVTETATRLLDEEKQRTR
jgi:ABC-type amino acid transport system permease subunit